jgi:hypothetical protein
MTNTELRATVRRRINQTDNTNTQFHDDMIDELGDQARRMFAAILPESILHNLRQTEDLSPVSGLASYPATFLRKLKNPRILVDGVYAEDLTGEMWRLKLLESNDNVKSGTTNKYYWEADDGIHCLPTSATTITYKFIRVPDALDGDANDDMPFDVDDMVVDFAFEKLMGTRRGDKDLAVFLAQNRGYLAKAVRSNA